MGDLPARAAFTASAAAARSARAVSLHIDGRYLDCLVELGLLCFLMLIVRDRERSSNLGWRRPVYLYPGQR